MAFLSLAAESGPKWDKKKRNRLAN